MPYSRRLFLQKSIVSTIVSSFVSLPTVALSLGESRGLNWVQLDSDFNLDQLKASLEPFVNARVPSIAVVTEDYRRVKGLVEEPKEMATTLINFDSTLLGLSDDDLSSAITNAPGFLINSNLDKSKRKPLSLLKEKLIFKVRGESFGALGISFSGENNSVSQILKVIQVKSHELKAMGCDRVICLLENPGERMPYLSYRDFIEKSTGIDWFFTSSTKKTLPEFLALRNASDQEVFLQVQAQNSKSNGIVHQDLIKGVFNFNIVSK